MQKQLLYQFLLETHNEAGKLFSFLYKNKKRSKRTNDMSMQVIPAAVLKVLGMLLIRIAYVLAFMYIPYKLLSVLCIAEGFQLRQSVVYFTVILSCVCGSLINSGMLDMDEDAYVMLTTMQMDPTLFFAGRVIYKLTLDGLGFLIAYLIIEIDFPHALYLMIWLLISRIVGEAVNLYVFRYTGRIISEIPGIAAVIMATCVFMSYGFPFLRNHVVDFTCYIYDYLWLLAGLIVAAVVGYGLFIYDKYSYIARTFIRRIQLNSEQDEDNAAKAELIMGENSTDGYFKLYEKDEAKGINYLHKVFFLRNADYVRNVMFIRVVLIVVATVIGVIICIMSGKAACDKVWSVLCDALPIMIFIMYWLSITPKLCKSMFYYIDCNMLENTRHITGVNNFRNYVVRLRIIGLYNMLLAFVLCAGFVAVGVASGQTGRLGELVPTLFGIVLLSLFYTVFNLTVYYMCQPYTKEMKTKGYTYFAANAAMLVICYGCVYIGWEPVVFDMVIGVVTGIMLSASSALIFYLSGKSFVIKK